MKRNVVMKLFFIVNYTFRITLNFLLVKRILLVGYISRPLTIINTKENNCAV